MRSRLSTLVIVPPTAVYETAFGDILGYARVSTSDQDVAGQTMRLTEAGAIKVFTDVRSGRSMERPGLDALLAFARDGDALAVVPTGSDAHSANC
jgi:predicted site-specific integrase-resolvase